MEAKVVEEEGEEQEEDVVESEERVGFWFWGRIFGQRKRAGDK